MAHPNNGLFVWYEHLTKDVKSAIAFYSEVVGWKTEPFSKESDYTMWVASQGAMGGIMTLPAEAAKMGVPPHWMGHVLVENVDATADNAKSLGGSVQVLPRDIPNVGRFSVIADPQGASLSIFTPGSGDPGKLHDMTKPGEICWNELLTSDQAGAFAFYSKLFGWKTFDEMDMGPMGTYRLYGIGDKQLGGMMSVKDFRPAWLYYVEVSDLDGALERAKRLGAKVMNGPIPVPSGGRIVQLMDPQGAVFALHTNPQK